MDSEALRRLETTSVSTQPHTFRAVGRPVLFGGHNLPPPLDEIGLKNLPKSGGATPRDDRPAVILTTIDYKPR